MISPNVLKIAGITVLVTVVAVLTILAMYWAYRGVDGWIASNKEDACIDHYLRVHSDNLARNGWTPHEWVRDVYESNGLSGKSATEIYYWFKDFHRDILLAGMPFCKREQQSPLP